jgi:hypothetical protein
MKSGILASTSGSSPTFGASSLAVDFQRLGREEEEKKGQNVQ